MSASARASSIEQAEIGEPLPADVQRLLAERCGLRLGETELAKAGRLLQAWAGRRFPSVAAYCASLSDTELGRELESICTLLTPGETYFFRDHGQFDLLRFQLLPEMIGHRRRERALRLWSAGCASGEEPYSLAMLVDMVLPERQKWQVTIVGSDINDAALAKAKRGRYGKWSFRMAPPRLQERYFRREGEEWALDDAIRRMVDFRRCNLVSAPMPDAVFRDMDLILCRNVLIYFGSEAVRAVAEKLAACLADNGYLMTGHTELIGHPLPGLRPRLFPEGVVHQAAGSRLPAPPRHGPAHRIPGAVMYRPPAAAKPVAASSPMQSPPREAVYADALALADRGDYAAAAAACRKALDDDPLAPAPHFVLAQLAQLSGNYREAENELNQTLYLAPEHIAAHLELAALHERAGSTGRALARRRTALELLRRLPAKARVEPFEANAGQLAEWLLATEAL